MPFAGVNGQRLYYEVGGDGETIVLIHGALASADIMEAPATGLASGFRALRYDRRGHGRSNPVTAPLSLTEEVADLASLLDWFSAPTTHILAHDEGAEVALEFILSYPSRVLSLGLLAPTVEGFAWNPEHELAHADLMTALRVDRKKGLEEKWFSSPIFDAAKEREGVADRIADIYRKSADTAYAFDRPPRERPHQIDRLGEIQVRSLVLVGDRDERERLRAAEAIADGIAGAELVTFPGLGRFLHIEESRTVMRRMTDFYMPEPEIER